MSVCEEYANMRRNIEITTRQFELSGPEVLNLYSVYTRSKELYEMRKHKEAKDGRKTFAETVEKIKRDHINEKFDKIKIYLIELMKNGNDITDEKGKLKTCKLSMDSKDYDVAFNELLKLEMFVKGKEYKKESKPLSLADVSKEILQQDEKKN